jgi:PPOX class probable F420-dependent enzyme
MAQLSEAQRAFIRDNAYYGVLTTLRPDGSPHSTVVWVDADDETVLFNTFIGRAKERHLRADPRASLLVVNPSDGYEWVSVSGRVRLETDGAVEMIHHLSRKYDGQDFPPEALARGERVTGRLDLDHVDSAGFDS